MVARLSIGLMLLALAAGTSASAQTPATLAPCTAKPTRACVLALAAVPLSGMDGIETLFYVAEAQLGTGDVKTAALTIKQAKTVAGTLTQDGQRNDALAALAIYETVIAAAKQAGAGEPGEASRTMAAIADEAQESEYIALLFASLAEGHARAGRMAAAANVMSVAAALAAAVKDDAVRRLALADVAIRQAAVQSAAGQVEDARNTAAGLAGNMRNDALYRIAVAEAGTQAKAGQDAQALRTAAAIDDALMRVGAFCVVANVDTRGNRLADATQALRRALAEAAAMPLSAKRDEAFARIAEAQAAAGQLAEAMATAGGLKNDVWRLVALEAIAEVAPD